LSSTVNIGKLSHCRTSRPILRPGVESLQTTDLRQQTAEYDSKHVPFHLWNRAQRSRSC